MAARERSLVFLKGRCSRTQVLRVFLYEHPDIALPGRNLAPELRAIVFHVVDKETNTGW